MLFPIKQQLNIQQQTPKRITWSYKLRRQLYKNNYINNIQCYNYIEDRFVSLLPTQRKVNDVYTGNIYDCRQLDVQKQLRKYQQRQNWNNCGAIQAIMVLKNIQQYYPYRDNNCNSNSNNNNSKNNNNNFQIIYPYNRHSVYIPITKNVQLQNQLINTFLHIRLMIQNNSHQKLNILYYQIQDYMADCKKMYQSQQQSMKNINNINNNINNNNINNNNIISISTSVQNNVLKNLQNNNIQNNSYNNIRDYVQQGWKQCLHKFIPNVDVIMAIQLYNCLCKYGYDQLFINYITNGDNNYNNTNNINNINKYKQICIPQILLQKILSSRKYFPKYTSYKYIRSIKISVQSGDTIDQCSMSKTMKMLFCSICYIYDCGKHQLGEQCDKKNYHYTRKYSHNQKIIKQRIKYQQAIKLCWYYRNIVNDYQQEEELKLLDHITKKKNKNSNSNSNSNSNNNRVDYEYQHNQQYHQQQLQQQLHQQYVQQQSTYSHDNNNNNIFNLNSTTYHRLSYQCGQNCYKLLDYKKYRITSLNKSKHLSPMILGLINIGIQIFNYNTCLITKLLNTYQNNQQYHQMLYNKNNNNNSHHIFTCCMVYTYLMQQLNLQSILHNKLYSSQICSLQNQQTSVHDNMFDLQILQPILQTSILMRSNDSNMSNNNNNMSINNNNKYRKYNNNKKKITNLKNSKNNKRIKNKNNNNNTTKTYNKKQKSIQTMILSDHNTNTNNYQQILRNNNNINTNTINQNNQTDHKYQQIAICFHNYLIPTSSKNNNNTIQQQQHYDCTHCQCATRGFCLPQCQCTQSCQLIIKGCACKNRDDCRSNKCSCYRNKNQCIPGVCYNCYSCQAFVPKKNLCANDEILRGKKKLIRVGESKIKGAGLGAFAGEKIKKNQLVAVYSGEIIQNQIQTIREIIKKGESFYNFGSSEGSIDARFMGNKCRFINHASQKEGKTNVVSLNVYSMAQEFIALYAQRDIGLGEQLFFDYDAEGQQSHSYVQDHPFLHKKYKINYST